MIASHCSDDRHGTCLAFPDVCAVDPMVDIFVDVLTVSVLCICCHICRVVYMYVQFASGTTCTTFAW